jgi:hypothetical protein
MTTSRTTRRRIAILILAPLILILVLMVRRNVFLLLLLMNLASLILVIFHYHHAPPPLRSRFASTTTSIRYLLTRRLDFGWVLATPQGTRLIGSKGTCNGRRNSLRAEGAGMLSGTLFLSIFSEYFDQSFKIVFISDNAELIRRMNAHKNYQEPFPNETLRSEFDVTEQIYKTQTASKIIPTY